MHANLAINGFNRPRICLIDHLDPVLLHDLSDFLADIVIFPRKQSLASLDDRYAASEPAVKLAEFESDVSTAQYQKMIGYRIEL